MEDCKVDPLCVLPTELCVHIFTFLDLKSLVLQASPVSSVWHLLARTPQLWGLLIAHLTRAKVLIPDLSNIESNKEKLRFLLRDANREKITKKELSGTISQWHFRFKPGSGRFLIEQDPYWSGKTPAKMTFHPNGRLERNATPFSTFLWRFVKYPTEIPAGQDFEFVEIEEEEAKLIQVNHFPPLEVCRYEKNWGWLLQNDYVVMTSFPLPPLNLKSGQWLGGGEGDAEDLCDDILENRRIPYLTHFAEFLQTAQDQDEDQDEGDVYGNEVEDDYSDDDDFPL